MIDKKKVRKAELFLRVLTNKRIRPVLRVLEDGIIPMTVTEIMVQTFRVSGREYSQSEISGILAELRKYGMVSFEREGKFIYYQLEYEKLEGMLNRIYSITKAMDDVS